MNKTSWILLISDAVIIAAFAFMMYQNSLETERLKDISSAYAKENESLKMDLEMLRKKLIEAENNKLSAGNDFLAKQNFQFKAMKEEIQRLKAENKPDNREREDLVWDAALENIKTIVDTELSKRLFSFGFKPEEVKVCVKEYQQTLERSKDLLLQWYRNEITNTEYEERILDISREFYNDLSASVGENLASITLSVVLPDYEFRRRMFEEK